MEEKIINIVMESLKDKLTKRSNELIYQLNREYIRKMNESKQILISQILNDISINFHNDCSIDMTRIQIEIINRFIKEDQNNDLSKKGEVTIGTDR